jgi:hypothetical protein
LRARRAQDSGNQLRVGVGEYRHRPLVGRGVLKGTIGLIHRTGDQTADKVEGGVGRRRSRDRKAHSTAATGRKSGESGGGEVPESLGVGTDL